MYQSNNKGGYYLHTNGDLIHKVDYSSIDVQSDFVVGAWRDDVIGVNPRSFLKFLKEAWRNGATVAAIERVGNRNKIDDFIPGALDSVFTTKRK